MVSFDPLLVLAVVGAVLLVALCLGSRSTSMPARCSADTFWIPHPTHSLSVPYGRSHFIARDGRLGNRIDLPAS